MSELFVFMGNHPALTVILLIVFFSGLSSIVAAFKGGS